MFTYQDEDSERHLWDTVDEATYIEAVKRIDSTPSLLQHKGVLLYDWPDFQEHLAWLITAPVQDIEKWARAIEAEGKED